MHAKRTLAVLVAVLVVGGVPTALAASTTGTQATAGDAVHVQDDAAHAQDETTTEEDDGTTEADGETEADDGTDADAGTNETTAAGESLVTNVTFTDQTSNGSAVVVQQVAIQTTKPPGGFVSIHLADDVTGDATNATEATNVTEEMIGPRIGNSSFLDPGEYRNLTVELTEPLADDRTLIAVVHRDSQGDEQFDPEADQAFEVDDLIVADAANVTVSGTDDGEATVGDGTTTDEEASDDEETTVDEEASNDVEGV